jgi:hypothetical protein
LGQLGRYDLVADLERGKAVGGLPDHHCVQHLSNLQDERLGQHGARCGHRLRRVLNNGACNCHPRTLPDSG